MKLFASHSDQQPQLAAKRPGARKKPDTVLDADGRRWPTLPPVPRDRVSELEETIAKLSAELTVRCTQVADLYNSRQQQANELLAACDEIDRLSKTIGALQDSMTQRDAEAAATQKKLVSLDKENITLRLQLEKAQKTSAELSQRSRGIETELDDRDAAVASIEDINSQLKAELAATQAETIRLAAELESANKQHGDELNEQSAQFKDRIGRVEAVVAEQATQVKDLEETRARLTERCNDLADTVAALESARKDSREKFIAQTVDVFETLLKVERNSAAARIKELTAELQRERLEHSATRRASAGIRENIVLLLPKLAALRGRPAASEPGPSIAANHAA